MLNRPRLGWVVAASGGGVILLALARCAGDDSTAAADAGARDAKTDLGAKDVLEDEGSVVDASTSCVVDGASAHDFGGYTRLASLDPCCEVDVPDDIASVPKLEWVPCQSGRSSCQEFKISWTNPDGPKRFAYARRYGSVPGESSLEVALWRGAAEVEDVVYDLGTATTLKSWRSNQLTGCFVVSATTRGRVVPIAYVRRDPFRIGDEARDSGVQRDAAFVTIPPSVIAAATENLSGYAISDTVLALAASPPGVIAVGPPGGPFVRASSQTQAVHTPAVFGDLVLALAEHGNAGFGQADKIALDGGITPFISKSLTHVSGVAADGGNLYWVEGSGSPNYTVLPSVCEVWTAPLSEDATAVASNAKKLASLPSCAFSVSVIAFDGYVAAWTGTDLVVVRASDGALRTVDKTINRTFSALVNVSSTEVWAIESAPKQPDLAFVRVTYPTW